MSLHLHIDLPDGLSNEDLLALGELLLPLDEANVGGQYVISLQCTTTNGNPSDCSPDPLFSDVQESVLQLPIYVKLAALYDNYHEVGGWGPGIWCPAKS